MQNILTGNIDSYSLIHPMFEILDVILGLAIAIVVAASTIYCIALGLMVSGSKVSYINHKTTISLDDAVKELENLQITGKSHEPRIGSKESIGFDIKGRKGCKGDCRDLPYCSTKKTTMNNSKRT